MKKLLFVNNNMRVGGVQKSLCNLLWNIAEQYDITLLLFAPVGAYMDELPPSVRVIVCESLFRYMGISQGECRTLSARLTRGTLAAAARVFGRPRVMPLLQKSQPPLGERFDCAIAFLHSGRKKSFYGGVQEFVLHCVEADRKVAFLHGDYGLSGANFEENNRMLARFDAVAACSDGCRRALLAAVPSLADTCFTVANCHRFDRIRALAERDTVDYPPTSLAVLLVARLTAEKGIDRAIDAVAYCRARGKDVTLHIVGDGRRREVLVAHAAQSTAADAVVFCGEDANPYRYMKHADLLLISSHHEAAPMIIGEAACLGLPVLTTETTSARDMVAQTELGWVCENDTQALCDALLAVADRALLHEKKARLLQTEPNNDTALLQFARLVAAQTEEGTA